MALDMEQIRADLNRRFAEPLPEFYKRRVIVWKDEEREDTLVEEISLGGRQYDRLEEIIAILCA